MTWAVFCFRNITLVAEDKVNWEQYRPKRDQLAVHGIIQAREDSNWSSATEWI